MSTRTDIHHGRRGGNWLPDDYIPLTERDATRCDVCAGPLLVGQRTRHHVCNTRSIVGRRCTCPPGCTDVAIGDGGTCNPGCEVCDVLAGQTYADIAPRHRWRKTAKKTTDADEAPTTTIDDALDLEWLDEEENPDEL